MRASAISLSKRELRYSSVLLLIVLAALALRLLPLFPGQVKIFDEVYYASDKSVPDLQRSLPHPPVALYMIKLSTAIWGPFGWRTGGALVGAMSIFVFCLLARRFLTPAFSLIAACLLAFDFLGFTLSRLAMLDIYAFFLSSSPSRFFFIKRDFPATLPLSCPVWAYAGAFPSGANGAALCPFLPAFHTGSQKR